MGGALVANSPPIRRFLRIDVAHVSLILPPDSEGFCNGQWLPLSRISLALDDLGVLQGVIAVERLRTYHTQIWQLDRHLERLSQTVETLGLGLLDTGVWRGRAIELVARNQRALESEHDVGLVLLVTPGRPGGPITEIAHLSQLDQEKIDRLQEFGERLVAPGVCAPPSACWPARLKVRSRLHYFLADAAAKAIEPSASAILVDMQGNLLETSAANLAVVCGSRVLVPPSQTVLPGVSAAIALEWLREDGMVVQPIPISRSLAESADEILLMGTGPFVWSATHLDGSAIRDGLPGRLSRQLLQKLRVAIGAAAP
jgi:branched-subunit amino acid aminotransferase/4-amino-4-deoxychorismate lyase